MVEHTNTFNTQNNSLFTVVLHFTQRRTQMKIMRSFYYVTNVLGMLKQKYVQLQRERFL